MSEELQQSKESKKRFLAMSIAIGTVIVLGIMQIYYVVNSNTTSALVGNINNLAKSINQIDLEASLGKLSDTVDKLNKIPTGQRQNASSTGTSTQLINNEK